MSPRRIIQVLTGFAFFIALAWLVMSPDYEPALTSVVMLAALIGEIVEEKKSGQKLVDTDLFQKFIKEFPANGSIRFIAVTDMAEPSFEMAKLNDLKTFLYEWDDVEHEFIDKKLEQKKKQLHKIVEQYLIAIGGKTYPTDKPGWNSVPVEWRLEQPQRYSETVKMLNDLAREVVNDHKIFYRAARVKLKCL